MSVSFDAVYFAYLPEKKAFYPVIQLNFETLECIVYSEKSGLKFVLKSPEYSLVRSTGINLPKQIFKTLVKEHVFEEKYCVLKEFDILRTKKQTESGENNFIIMHVSHSLRAVPISEDREVDLSCYIDIDDLMALDIGYIYDSLVYLRPPFYRIKTNWE